MAQLVEHHLAKVRVAGSNPVVRSGESRPVPMGAVFPGGVAERRGNGLQIRVHGFKSRLHLGRLAQRERASLTRKRSLVQISIAHQHHPWSDGLCDSLGAWAAFHVAGLATST